MGLTCPFLAQDAVYHPQFIEIAKEAAEGSFLTFGFTDKNTAAYKKYIAKYEPKYGKPGAYSGYSYDAAYVLLSAIKSAGSTDPAKIKAEIMKMNFQGATKMLKFRPNGDSGSDYVIWKVENGEFKSYWNPTTGKLF